jgi:hypothetical protein
VRILKKSVRGWKILLYIRRGAKPNFAVFFGAVFVVLRLGWHAVVLAAEKKN